ncbi:MAG: SLC13 family permease [Candidatus Marinimicrobia bacterium]|nr:SLC13 family permease [Candidatus Neomarinimicrobiota bacterium]
MTIEIAALILIMVVVLIILFLELFPVDVIAIGLMTILWLAGFVNGNEAISGFSNKAVLTVAVMFILSRALIKTGILETLIQSLANMGNKRKWFGIGVFLILVSIFSGFINNVAAVAICIPIAIKLANNSNISPSKILIPLSYAAIYGGTLTLIGTSTNLLVSSIVEDYNLQPLGMFEFLGLGCIFLVVGTTYNFTILPKLLPARAGISSLVGEYNLATYLTEFQISESSPLINSTCLSSRLNETYDITVLSIIRGRRRYNTNIRNIKLKSSDILITRGTLKSFKRFRNKEQLLSLSDTKIDEKELREGENILVEGLINQGSGLIGKTVKEVDFRRKYGAFVLAINRYNSTLKEKIAHVKLKFSDTLLILVPQSQFPILPENNDLIILQKHDIQFHKHRFWWLATFIIPAIMITAAMGILDILAGALIGLFLLFISRNISTHEAYQAINWQVVVFIAAFIPFGIALEKTGAASLIGLTFSRMGDLFDSDMAPYIILSFTYLVTSLMTEVLSNNAAAIVLTPIAIATANGLGVDPRPFVFAICFAASASFMTPMGYQTNLMVYGPGKYRFADYLKAGIPLNILFWILASVLIPIFWPFTVKP